MTCRAEDKGRRFHLPIDEEHSHAKRQGKQVGPKVHGAVMRAIPAMSWNHQLNSPKGKFIQDALFPNREKAEPYDFGAPEDAEWYINEIISHQWRGWTVEFLVKWNMGDSTWEPLMHCNELIALDDYLTLMNVKQWQDLPKRLTKMSWNCPHDRVHTN
jgi:hypothetical protein